MLIRHGDVMLVPAEKATEKKIARSPVLALGEVTGHRHEIIDGDVFLSENDEVVVVARAGTTIQHLDRSGAVVEHGVLEVPAGEYIVRIERDCNPWTNMESGAVLD
jgi:hypothetical protein